MQDPQQISPSIGKGAQYSMIILNTCLRFLLFKKASFVAPNSVIIGNVSMGDKSSIWYGATIRGDLAKISLGTKAIV